MCVYCRSMGRCLGMLQLAEVRAAYHVVKRPSMETLYLLEITFDLPSRFVRMCPLPFCLLSPRSRCETSCQARLEHYLSFLMSTPARYVAAWGFHTPFFKLYKAAYAWQQTKLFRLIKLRLQNTPQSPDSITLASLPNELLDMIEVEVFNQAMRNAYKHMPQSGCDCEDLMDEFRQLSDVEEDFEDFCLAGPGMKRSEEKWEEFRKTATYETMWKSYKSYHAEACESWASTNQRWRELLSVCASGTVCVAFMGSSSIT